MADACVSYGATACTDNVLRFGGSFPWETSDLDFTSMGSADSWQVSPALTTVQQATAEIGDPGKVVLNVYFRQPFVLDEESGLRDSGAIVADFGTSDTALLDVLSGEVSPQGRMPFALAGTREAIEQQASDLPGYDETDDGALFPFGFGLTYDQDETAQVQRIYGRSGMPRQLRSRRSSLTVWTPSMSLTAPRPLRVLTPWPRVLLAPRARWSSSPMSPLRVTRHRSCWSRPTRSPRPRRPPSRRWHRPRSS
ncbi:hypothetical protein GCM10009583_01590 [Ornithinicoccus hortensis]|nr:glycoside hydrolase family 3 C-terminal domain-containing protein [Ornithinicoccus hortensis]